MKHVGENVQIKTLVPFIFPFILFGCTARKLAVVIRTQNELPYIPCEKTSQRVFSEKGSATNFVGYENWHQVSNEANEDVSYVKQWKRRDVQVNIYIPEKGNAKMVADTLKEFIKPVVFYYIGKYEFGKSEGASLIYQGDSIAIMKKWGYD